MSFCKNYMSGQNLVLKLWSKMFSTYQIAGFFKLSFLKNYLRYNVHFFRVVRYPWKLWLNHVIFVGFGKAFPGMLKLFQNKKTLLSPRRLELFCLFVVCSYLSMEATVLSWRFSWVWSCMPKVFWNNNSPISLERVLSDFVNFLDVVVCILLDIYWSYKNMLFWVGIVRYRLSANQIVWCFLNLKNSKTIWNFKLIFRFYWSYKKYHAILGYDPKILLANQFAGLFIFDLFDLLILILGVHCCIVLVFWDIKKYTKRLTETKGWK